MRPADAKFTASHEYALIEGDIATIGLADFAVEHLSDLVFIDIPEVGTDVTANEPFGEVESVKAVAEISSPVSGEIIEVNEALSDDLTILSNDTYGEGWIIKVRMSDTAQAEQLMDAKAYEKHVEASEV